MIPEGQRYYRLSGNGNDFLALAEPESRPSPHEIRAWCRRGVGLGADGLFVIERRKGTGTDSPALLRMAHFNADGGETELCLNGTRCAARLALALGWAHSEVVIETPAGKMRASIARNGTEGHEAIRVEVPLAPTPALHRLEVPGSDEPLAVWFVEVGVPHAVLEWHDSLERLDPAELGPLLRHHEQFAPAGANVDFVHFATPHRLELRTWERGVEGETLACGTGILAAARVGLELGRLELPAQAQTLGGFPTRVEGDLDPDGALLHWALVSDARLLARGQIAPEAAITPPPVVWSK